MQNNQQRMLLFDHRFVANTMHETLKCASCHFNFSPFFEKSRAKSNRPILLPCAHPMCENCVQQNFKNLACPECSRPVLIPEKYLNHREFKFRHTFELDLFLMGTLLNVHYYCPDSVSNISINLNASENSNRRLEQQEAFNFNIPKCEECDLALAAGECSACTPAHAFCKKCFTKIHENGKVFKTHKLIHWDKLMPKEQSDYFPTPEYCRLHKSYCDQYCKKCDKVICRLCGFKAHKDHGFIHLERRNSKYVDGFGQLLEAVKQTSDQIRKSQRVCLKN